MSQALLVFGAGGHGKVVADAALAAGWRVCGFADDRPALRDQRILDLPVVATGRDQAVQYCQTHGARLVVAVGHNRIRADIFRALQATGVALATVVHPSAVVARSARLGAGSVVFANAVINPAATVGDNVIVNTAAAIDHDSEVHAHVHLAPGARTGGTVTIGAGTMLGIGACVRNNVSIGAWSMIGMGSVVVADLPDRVLAFGNPARVRGPFPAPAG